MAITNRLQAELIRNFSDRERQAVRDARLLAENSGQVSEALRQIDPKLETAVLALAEFVEFQKSIRADIQAIGGHAAEGSDLALSHSRDVANVATVGINLPEIMDAQPLGLEEIPPAADDLHVEQLVQRLAYQVRKARLDHPGQPLRVGLIIDAESEER